MCKSIDGTIRPKFPEKYSKDVSKIFGAPENHVSTAEPVENLVHQDNSEKPSAFTYSFANVLNRNPNKKMVKIHELRNTETVDGASVAIPMEAVEAVSTRFANTLYGYFIGKRLAFPLVENYVKNTWAKYGLKRIQLHEDFFMFQFNTKEGMESVMENGKPIMMDSYTSNMCLSSWGRNTYARILVEFSTLEELKKSIVIAIPRGNGKGHSLATVDIEYEWSPPRCSRCMVFDHNSDKCPTLPKVVAPVNDTTDGFTKVKRKNSKSKQNQKNKKHVPKPHAANPPVSELNVSNSFGILEEKEDDNFYDDSRLNDDVLNVSDDEVDEEIEVGRDGNVTSNIPGASTPVNDSHASSSNLHRLCSLVFKHWDWTSNGSWCLKGTRIIMGWNRNDVDVVVINQDDQVIHTRVWMKLERKEVFCSFVYAHNKYTQRRSLWKSLDEFHQYVRNRPWTIMGDFNASLFLDESTASGSKVDIAMREFRDCVNMIEVSDVQRTGLQFTWNQKPKGGDGLLKKLDRVMANSEFQDHFVGAHAIFKPYRVSDHSPAVLCIPMLSRTCPKPFKFFNILTSHDKFSDVVKDVWDQHICGFHMFRVVKKLKCLKKPLRKLLYEKGNLHANVVRIRADLDSIQASLDVDPFNATLREAEAKCVVEFNQAVLLEERLLKQKAKVQWLAEGDANSAYFHKAVKSRTSRSRIDVITNSEGVVFQNSSVPDAFVSHYEAFLGCTGETGPFNSVDLFKSRLNEQDALYMVREVSFQEVKDALFSMGDDKSPEVNHTIIAALPKVKSPSRINDYKPISCCNVLFKCLSKIIANRIKQCLKHIVSPNQSAFVPGRSITDNILLTQELMHNYHLDRGSPRCAFKVNIQKAYDTVDWNFLCMILHGFGFHDKMVSWIMECVTSTSYSININGSIHGFFKGKRGLCQGDPLSPYLFTLVMDVLTLMLQRKIHESDQFTYHRYCSKLELVNLCFADDLFLFAYGDVHSVSIIKEALDEFKVASGLLYILQVLPFEEGTLSIKYFGVPLVSSRLKIRDCNELVDRVQLRISDWKNKSLSIAGRLQLIQSVLGSMHIYWASVFMLSSNVLLNIKQLMRQFLWSHGKSGKSKSKVTWEVVCLPKDEGGLGIRRLEYFNYALMSSLIWKLLTLKESLWVKWIHEYKIKGRNFWDIPLRGNMSWGWRKILNLCPKVRNFIWKVIGNGVSTSLWYDKWTDLDPLATRISPCDIHNAGLSFQSKVSDIVVQACIPRHAFNLWLVIRKRLKTQDLIPAWDSSAALGMVCSLCECIPDSHDHLFFGCSFARGVWDRLKDLACIDLSTPNIYDIIGSLLPIVKKRTSKSVCAKLVVAATAYFIWQERNWRLFKKGKRSTDQLVECVKASVRLKLLSCKLKKSSDGDRMARLWDLPEAIFI
ncbi:hypothetical protein Tco_0766808 [Tanacetum coccineum]